VCVYILSPPSVGLARLTALVAICGNGDGARKGKREASAGSPRWQGEEGDERHHILLVVAGVWGARGTAAKSLRPRTGRNTRGSITRSTRLVSSSARLGSF
jgi:hypothetical protein